LRRIKGAPSIVMPVAVSLLALYGAGCTYAITTGIAQTRIRDTADPALTVVAEAYPSSLAAHQSGKILLAVNNTGAPIPDFQLNISSQHGGWRWSDKHRGVTVSPECKLNPDGRDSSNYDFDRLDCGTLPTGVTEFWLRGSHAVVSPRPMHFEVTAPGHKLTAQAFLHKTTDQMTAQTTFTDAEIR
jgi:hypothetical protein